MEKLLTIEELSDLIKVSKGTIYHWTQVSYIPKYKFPKRISFIGLEIECWKMAKRNKGRGNYVIKVIE